MRYALISNGKLIENGKWNGELKKSYKLYGEKEREYNLNFFYLVLFDKKVEKFYKKTRNRMFLHKNRDDFLNVPKYVKKIVADLILN